MSDFLSSLPALLLIGAIVIPLVVYLILGTGEKIIERFVPERAARRVRPWFWLLIPLALVVLILVYPMVGTIVGAFQNATGGGWVGIQNLVWTFSGGMLAVLGNNIIWLVLFPLGTLILALIVAVIFDRVQYERLAITIVVLPTAISFAAGSVIWRQIYGYSGPGVAQTGLLNAVWTLIPGAKAMPWLQVPFVNTLCLIVVAVWASVGVAALILSAAVKGVPAEYLEAARIDGAGEWRIFFSITLPYISPALLVVITTEVIFALKTFDIVYVMTNGDFNTNTIGNQMYFELFANQNLGHASAIALVLFIVALPVVFINIRQFRAEAK